MKDEDFIEEGMIEEDEYLSEEEIDDLEPEMQGFVQGWKKAGKSTKKELDEFDEEY